MILINELNGNVIVKSGITLTGDLATKSMMLTGSLVNGGTRTYPAYTGEYTFTPTRAEQVIEIKNMRATQNIVVEPIPSNYGMISWDGSGILIS